MPQQCPECARFLSGEFVAGLTTAAAPCPRCETTLVAEMFVPAPPAPGQPPAGTAPPPGGPTAEPVEAGSDPLAGWDTADVPRDPARSWPVGERDTEERPLAVLAALTAAVVGALAAPRGRIRGATLGAVTAAVVALLTGRALRR